MAVLEELLKKAESGDVESQYQLGYNFMNADKGFVQDSEKGYFWLCKAANSNHAKAQGQLGYFYLCKGDTSEAISWYEKGAANGNEYSVMSLTVVYSEPSYGMSDADKFLKWTKVLANEYNDAIAIVELGIIYCGREDSTHVKLYGLTGLLKYQNIEEGLRLIEKGVKVAESLDENPLKFHHYEDASDVYLGLIKAHDCDLDSYDYKSQGKTYLSHFEYMIHLRTKNTEYAKKAALHIKMQQEPKPSQEHIKIYEDAYTYAKEALKIALEAHENVKGLEEMDELKLRMALGDPEAKQSLFVHADRIMKFLKQDYMNEKERQGYMKLLKFITKGMS